MKLIDIDSKATLEDFLTLKKTELVQFLRKCNEKISGNKNELAFRSFNANQVICGANSSVDDDVISDKDSVEDKEVSLISELNTGWSSKENLFPQISHKDVETYLLKSRSDDNEKMSCYRQFIRGFNFYKENYIHDIMINMIDDDSKRCYIRSKCFPSMKTGTYSQWLLMTKENPIIISKAHCTCPAG
jgi:hypothetical protein